MRIAIAGAGNVGTFVAADLRSRGNDVVLIEQSKDQVE
ncbi:MAG: 2-dehydropantoate 2-reductase N-terminal domain-containing protein, partial [Actinomycetota bacterium]